MELKMFFSNFNFNFQVIKYYFGVPGHRCYSGGAQTSHRPLLGCSGGLEGISNNEMGNL